MSETESLRKPDERTATSGEFIAPAAGCAVALLAAGLACVARLALDPYLKDAQPFPLFYVATAVVAWWAGWRSALVVVTVGYVLGDWFFVPPRYTLGVEDLPHLLELLTYFAVTGTTIWLMASLQRARGRANANAQAALREQQQLEVEVQKRQRAEEELARSNQELERLVQERTAKLRRAVEDLEHFSYAIVHDMRAPLRALRNFAELQEEECAGCPRTLTLDYFQRMKTAATRMDRLITDSLSYGKVVLQDAPPQPVNLDRLVRDLIKTYPNLQPDQADRRLATVANVTDALAIFGFTAER
jgi:signal transduction histidine kinase